MSTETYATIYVAKSSYDDIRKRIYKLGERYASRYVRKDGNREVIVFGEVGISPEPGR